MKPIRFNPEMVRAILEGRKTVTRRVCKIAINDSEDVAHRMCHSAEYPARNKNGNCAHFLDMQGHFAGSANQPYSSGDILYVRETWLVNKYGIYSYKASSSDYHYEMQKQYGLRWRPSIHMPREAARIFLRVTGVRVERLQNINYGDILRDFGISPLAIQAVERDVLAKTFWDSTIKKKDIETYGWDANPWVWVIEFERCEKPEE